MPTWRTISVDEHGFSLRIPALTPGGERVRISSDQRSGVHRVHAASPDESELYFEVVSYPGLIDHEQAAAEQKTFLLSRSPDAAVTPSEPGLWTGRRCTGFVFEGVLDGKIKRRRFCFVDSTQRTFRLVYDPGSMLNRRLLAELVIQDR